MTLIVSTTCENAVDRHVGARIRARRLDLHKTQTQLAKALGVSFQQIQKYEAGQSRLSTSALFIVARALDVCPDYFFDGFEADFAGMQAPRRRRQIIALVRSLGERQG